MVFGLRVTQNLFVTLGVFPRLGRNFTPDEDHPSSWHVVVLSYPYWIRQFGADENVIGKAIVLDQIPFEIVSVLPPHPFKPLSFTDAGSPPDVWAPLGYDMSRAGLCLPHVPPSDSVARSSRAGVTVSQARAEMATITSQLVREFPKDYSEHENHFGPAAARHLVRQGSKHPVWLLSHGETCVLRRSRMHQRCKSSARSGWRRKIVKSRFCSAIGAGRARIVRQLLTEERAPQLFRWNRRRRARVLGHALARAVGASANSARRRNPCRYRRSAALALLNQHCNRHHRWASLRRCEYLASITAWHCNARRAASPADKANSAPFSSPHRFASRLFLRWRRVSS